MQLLSQRDPRWANLKMGGSDLTVGNYGCLFTSIIALSNFFYGETKWTPDKLCTDAALFVNGEVNEVTLCAALGNLTYSGPEVGYNPTHIKQAINSPSMGVVVEVAIQQEGDHFLLGDTVSLLSGAIMAVDPWPLPACAVNVIAKYGPIIGGRYFIHKA